MKQELVDYDFDFQNILIRCDNTIVINLTKNLIQHSCMKDIEIKHHFIHDYVNDRDVIFEFMSNNEQFIDIFTKLLDHETFQFIRNELEMCNLFK